MLVRGNSLWVAENTGSVLVIDLTVCCFGFSLLRDANLRLRAQTNEKISTFRCHQAPTTSFAFVDKVPGSRDGKIMITGSWDKVST